MRTLFTLFFIAFFSFTSISAQSSDSLQTPKFRKYGTAGVKGGINLASLEDFSNNSIRIGLVVGLTGEYRVSRVLGIATEVNYSQQGTYLEQLDLGLNYLSLPVLLTLHDRNFAVQAGAYGAVLLKAKANYGKITEDVTEYFNQTETGLCVGLAYHFWGNTVLSGRYYRGLQNLNKKLADPNLELENSTLQISCGYTF